MAFRFEKASCVVVGTFNMYILHPSWLVKRQIIETGVEVGIETNLTQAGFRFRFPKDKTVWSIAPNRLVLETKDPEADCGQIVAKILKALPETPLFGLGNNVHYHAELSELDNLSEAIREFPRTESPKPEQSVVQRTFHVGVKRSEQETVNLQILIKDDSVELACNIHTKLDGRDEANNEAIAAAEGFFRDQDMSEELARHFFGVTISHDANDD